MAESKDLVLALFSDALHRAVLTPELSRMKLPQRIPFRACARPRANAGSLDFARDDRVVVRAEAWSLAPPESRGRLSPHGSLLTMLGSLLRRS